MAEQPGPKAADLEPDEQKRADEAAPPFRGVLFPADISTADLVKALTELKEQAESETASRSRRSGGVARHVI